MKFSIIKTAFIVLLAIAINNSYGQFLTPGSGVDYTAIPVRIDEDLSASTPFNGVSIGHGLYKFTGNTAVGFNSLISTNPLSVFKGAQDNTAIGSSALKLTTSGRWNTAVGSGALAANTTGYYNSALGYLALNSSTTGTRNCAFGLGSAQFLTTGYENIFIGEASGAGASLTTPNTGYYNVGIGGSALIANAGGYTNTALGYNAMASSTGGRWNTAVGAYALNQLTTGDYNVCIGENAAVSFTNGSNNISLGHYAAIADSRDDQLSINNVITGISITGTGTGFIAIGRTPAATAGGSTSRLHVGGSGSTQPSLQLDNVPTYTGGGSVPNPSGSGKFLFIDADGIVTQATPPGGGGGSGISNPCTTAGTIPKIVGTSGNLDCSQLFDDGTSVGVHQTTGFGFTTGVATTITPGSPAPTTFRLGVDGWVSGTGFTSLSDKRLKKDIKQIENPLEKISKISGYTYNWNKDFKTTRQLDNNRQAGFLAQEVLEVLPEAVIKADDGIYGLNYNAVMPLLAEGIKAQQNEIELLKNEVRELKNKVNQLVPGNVIVKDEIFQVVPNPVTGVSTISYKLTNNISAASFVVYDLQGKMLKQYSINTSAKESSIQIQKKDFTNGMYILSLISNNQEIESKRFIIAE